MTAVFILIGFRRPDRIGRRTSKLTHDPATSSVAVTAKSLYNYHILISRGN